MKDPLIKTSHKGLLHQDLGIPQGQPIPKEKLEAAKDSPKIAVRKRANFAINFNAEGHHGVVDNISMTHDGKFARVSVKHTHPGKKKRNGVHSPYDYEHSSTVVMRAKHAKKLKIGQKVGVGAIALPDGEPDDAEDTLDSGADEDQEMDHDAAESNYRSTMRGITSFGKKVRKAKRER